MSDLLEIISRLEESGGTLTMDGDRIRYHIPSGRSEARELLSALKERREEVLELLRKRSESPEPWTPYVMPKGVRLVQWEPKAAPVAIETCSIVVDVPKFIKAELQALDSRLNNPSTIHGGFTVLQMLERLRQVGVTVEIDLKAGAR